MSKKSRRQARREQARRRRQRAYLVWGGVTAAVVALLGFLIWVAVRPAVTPALGEEIPVQGANHVPEGSDPGPYNSDPPTSGPHYPVNLRAGFYDESDLEQLGPHPEGYLVHSLEHGYVIIWYNCEVVSEEECSQMKDQIRQVMAEFDNIKIIAFPWFSIEEAAALTSWGRLLRMERFDLQAAREFIDRNRFRAPEPNAP